MIPKDISSRGVLPAIIPQAGAAGRTQAPTVPSIDGGLPLATLGNASSRAFAASVGIAPEQLSRIESMCGVPMSYRSIQSNTTKP